MPTVTWYDWGEWSPSTWGSGPTSTGITWGDLPTWGALETWVSIGDAPTPTVTRYYLTPQSMEQGFPTRDAYGHFLRHRVGKTLVKRNGVWSLVRNKRQDWLDECDVVLRGGYDNEVTSAQKTELEALGYTIETRTS